MFYQMKIIVFILIILSSTLLSTNSFSQSSDLIHFKCIIKESYSNSVKKNIYIKEEYFTINRKEGWGKLAIDEDEDYEDKAIDEYEDKAIDNLENKQFKTKKVNKNAE